MKEYLTSKLTPFDSELCLMVESLTGRDCEPKSGGPDQYFIVVDYRNHPEPEYIAAIMDAVAGRVGERLIDINDQPDAQQFIAYIKFSDANYNGIVSKATDTRPLIAAGYVYCRQIGSVRAIQVTRNNVQRLMEFVGNGEMEIERRPGGKATFHFRNAVGSVFAHAPEFSYIVHVKDGLFNVVDKETFEKEYEPK